jgi:hypothetical protein
LGLFERLMGCLAFEEESRGRIVSEFEMLSRQGESMLRHIWILDIDPDK